MGWLERRRQRREDDRRFNEEFMLPMMTAMQTRLEESRESGLPVRPLVKSEVFGGETILWRALVQLVTGSDYVGFNFFYHDGQLGMTEIESPKPGHIVGHGVTEWPDFVDEDLKLAVFSHAAYELRDALGLEQENERLGDLEELGIEIIWDPPLPA